MTPERYTINLSRRRTKFWKFEPIQSPSKPLKCNLTLNGTLRSKPIFQKFLFDI